jgi:DNA-binding NarL/FixJ family response regulator
VWWRSRHDNRAHAFPALQAADRDRDRYTAACSHTAVPAMVIRSNPVCLPCGLIVGVPTATRPYVHADAARCHSRTALDDALTEREKRIVGMVCKGLSNKEIACVLVLSEDTVRVLVCRILNKRGARTRAHLVFVVATNGELPEILRTEI